MGIIFLFPVVLGDLYLAFLFFFIFCYFFFLPLLSFPGFSPKSCVVHTYVWWTIKMQGHAATTMDPAGMMNMNSMSGGGSDSEGLNGLRSDDSGGVGARVGTGMRMRWMGREESLGGSSLGVVEMESQGGGGERRRWNGGSPSSPLSGEGTGHNLMGRAAATAPASISRKRGDEFDVGPGYTSGKFFVLQFFFVMGRLKCV